MSRWTGKQREAAFNVIYADIEKVTPFASFVRDKIWTLTNAVLDAPDKASAYVKARAYVATAGFGGQVTDAQLRAEVDKVWATAAATAT